jgi:hypothetical protein
MMHQIVALRATIIYDHNMFTVLFVSDEPCQRITKYACKALLLAINRSFLSGLGCKYKTAEKTCQRQTVWFILSHNR